MMPGHELTDEQLAERAFRLAQSGQHRDAISIYSQLLSMYPAGAVFHQRGLSYLACNELEKALSDFSSAIASDDKDADSLINRGNVYLQMKQYQFALADYNKALKLRPASSYALNGRGSALWKLGRLEEAHSDFWDSVAANSLYASPIYNLAALCFENGDFSAALGWLDRADALRPGDKKVRDLRDRILQESAVVRDRD